MMTIALLLLLLAGLLFWLAQALRQPTGIPWVRVVGSDTGGGRTFDHPLFARSIGLTGKPDYVLEKRGVCFPVEVKPGREATSPYESDVMQVAAYCLLLEATTGHSPPYGLLRYARITFRIPYTPAVRDRVLSVLEAMRADLTREPCARSHTNPSRCRSCGFVAICEESLISQ
ncbi:MAG: Dna2/Cas4 domain-containing protein [Chloroflexaceae bacterium]|nr:Dna2/Cas4 domain-containing protein [Chloroflexaceae bacterium]